MPAPQQMKCVSTPMRAARVTSSKFAFAVVAIEAVGVFGEMRLEKIDVAVEIVVADADAHAGLLLSVIAERDAAHHAFFAKRAVVIVHEEEARRGIAGDKNIGPAVFVEIGGNGGHAVAAVKRGDPPRLRVTSVNVPSPLLR